MALDEKAHLIERLDAARASMQAVIERIDIQVEIYPGWTIKHVLAHIAGWDDATADSLRAFTRHEEPSIPAYRGIDDYNAQSVATRKELNYEQTRREWELARDQLKAAINTIPAQEIKMDLLYPWGPRGPIKRLVEIMIHHEQSHAGEIEKLLAKPKSE